MERNDEELQAFIREYLRTDTGPYYFYRSICLFLAYLIYRPKFIGKENIPKEGPVILASNHAHLPDPAFVLISTHRVVRYLAKKELLESSLGPIYKASCTIPVDRVHGAHNSLVTAKIALNEGEVIGIFPEGTRNKNRFRELLPFKIGAVKMASDTGAPIVPIALISKGKPFIHPYKIVIGEPYQIVKDCDLEAENERLRNKIYQLLQK